VRFSTGSVLLPRIDPLPLASFAKVINLDNGRSVIVKINDRGPFTRGRILDLSPRAADALDMKRAGVAAVVLEPLVDQAAPIVAVFETSKTSMAHRPTWKHTPSSLEGSQQVPERAIDCVALNA
jgi:rare lipoprotein A